MTERENDLHFVYFLTSATPLEKDHLRNHIGEKAYDLIERSGLTILAPIVDALEAPPHIKPPREKVSRDANSLSFYMFLGNYCINLDLYHIPSSNDDYYNSRDTWMGKTILKPAFARTVDAEKSLFAQSRLQQKKYRKHWKEVRKTVGNDTLHPGKDVAEILVFMRDFLQSVDDSTIIHLHPSERRRARLYKNVFKDNTNVYR